jgi:hypothetical protein
MAKSGLPMRFLSLMGILPQAFECARGNTMLRVGYRRGRIEILDRNGLKAAACECYEVVSRTFDQFLEDKQAPR